MKLFQRNSRGASRTGRRPEMGLELLEGRSLLSTVGPARPVPAQVQPPKQTFPMQGTVQGVVVLGEPTTVAGNVVVPVSSTGSGTLAGIGPVTITESHHTVILASSGYTSSVTPDGRATVTVTATGDQIFIAFVGTGVKTDAGFDDTFHYVVTGGTGRFAGATGGGTISSTDLPGDPSTPYLIPYTFDIQGTITTGPSKKH